MSIVANTIQYGSDPLSTALRRHDERHLSAILIGQTFAPPALAIAQRATINRPLDEDADTFLHIACRTGDRFLVWLLIEAGASAEIENRFSETPLDVVGRRSAEVRDEITRIVERTRESHA